MVYLIGHVKIPTPIIYSRLLICEYYSKKKKKIHLPSATIENII